jgi:large subunit ribosomal protein L14e
MGDAEITTSAWRQVEVGRVVLFNEGEFEGRLAVIVEIIDHKRVRILRDLGAVQQLTET